MGGIIGGDDNSAALRLQQEQIDKQNALLEEQKKKAEKERMNSLKTRLSGGSIFDQYDQKNNTTLG